MKRRDGEIEFDAPQFRLRARFLALLIAATALALLGRSVQLQVFDLAFITEQANMRHARTAPIVAHRGAILDRYGEPLAVSSPVETVWVNPPEFAEAGEGIAKLARALNLNRQWLEQRVTSNLDREFLYVTRHIEPEEAAAVRKLKIPGVYFQREYKRFYPNTEVTGHLLGFTNLDEAGQEGLELAYDRSLAGKDGQKRVIQDGHGQVIANVEVLRAPTEGEDLVTSIDLRLQYLAYRELKSAMREHEAHAGSVIVLDIATGEVLAMVNQPSFNPNDRTQYEVGRYRNRAVTDIFEPGSSIKSFIMAAALESGRYRTDSRIDATPFKVGSRTIRDHHDLGVIDMGKALALSSNVALAKIALSLDSSQLYATLRSLGFGKVTESGFPGESAGLLSSPSNWRQINVATMAYGYGISVTPLQLAQAYATIGAGGIHRPVSFRKLDAPPPGQRVLPAKVARDLIGLLEGVVTTEGATGRKAAVPGYQVAGKTGTAWKAIPGGYSTDRYLSVFGGVVPATDPQLAVVVMVDEPQGDFYYGGDVAAPVFSTVSSGALRLMSVAPDDLAKVTPIGLEETGP
ncbi:MAG TPA: penicillin-binding transpeptidase domain-containing protein [Steroidobacteraceae bacterium]|jgi:cell division protein FtsI (penicillin-binding protein 3)|nr:penicillin-binding transpeptidase domain-containing protein [Steroidobacteraceae bacterium]